MSSQPAAPSPVVTVDDLLKFMVDTHFNSKKVFEILCAGPDEAQYKQVLGEIDAINASERPAGKSKAQWEGEKKQRERAPVREAR